METGANPTIHQPMRKAQRSTCQSSDQSMTHNTQNSRYLDHHTQPYKQYPRHLYPCYLPNNIQRQTDYWASLEIHLHNQASRRHSDNLSKYNSRFALALGVVQVILGSFSLVCNAAGIHRQLERESDQQNWPFLVAPGIWAGFLFLSTGGLSIVSGQKKTRWVISCCLVWCLLAAGGGICTLSLSAVALSIEMDKRDGTSHPQGIHYDMTSMVMSGLLLVVSAMETVCAVVTALHCQIIFTGRQDSTHKLSRPGVYYIPSPPDSNGWTPKDNAWIHTHQSAKEDHVFIKNADLDSDDVTYQEPAIQDSKETLELTVEPDHIPGGLTSNIHNKILQKGLNPRQPIHLMLYIGWFLILLVQFFGGAMTSKLKIFKK